ncbi:MAG: hypothetical protein FWE35_04985 [Streptosporangiales bacterium]|nr:hypothetical protein [Streptosporangiales bacterium]
MSLAAAAAGPSPLVLPVSRYWRAARQIGHHWHSGGSSAAPGGSVVAVSHTSAECCCPPPTVERTRSVTSRPRPRAPAFAPASPRCISQR